MNHKIIKLYDWSMPAIHVERLRASFFVIPGMKVSIQSSYAERAIYLRLAHPNYTTNETLEFDNSDMRSIEKLVEYYEVAKNGRKELDSRCNQETGITNGYGRKGWEEYI
jgi:hypothetical protein